MGIAKVNGAGLFYEVHGTGEIPLVLVHGSWASHQDWDLVAPPLAQLFRVVTYDRRGHSQSDRPSGQGSIREDVADLAGLIEHLGLAPAWVAGNSFGGSITLRLAGDRPDLFQGLIVHEPPLFSIVADDPAVAPLLEKDGQVGAVLGRIASGDHAGAAEQFVENVALGPGSWVQLPREMQQTMIGNAVTFLDEANDPEQLAFELGWIQGFQRPALLTLGDQSPPIFAPVVAKLAEALPDVHIETFFAAGHIPHVTHPEEYVEAVVSFIRGSSMGASASSAR